MNRLGRQGSFFAISIWGALALPFGCADPPRDHIDASADAEGSDAATIDGGGGDTSTTDTGLRDVGGADVGGNTGLGDVGGADATTVDGQGTPTADLCGPTGMFDFSVHGAGFEAWEGATIRAAAVEPTSGGKTFPVVVRQTAVIAGGAFALACPLSLSRNSWYPSVGLYIDTDGDGRCSPTDLGYESLYFAWSSSVDKGLTAPMSAWPAIGGRLGGTSTIPFCAYYGF